MNFDKNQLDLFEATLSELDRSKIARRILYNDMLTKIKILDNQRSELLKNYFIDIALYDKKISELSKEKLIEVKRKWIKP